MDNQYQYKVRCDKHGMRPYEYCEMCMIRTQLQETLDICRQEMIQCVSSYNLAHQVYKDVFLKMESQIKTLQEQVNELSNNPSIQRSRPFISGQCPGNPPMDEKPCQSSE